jgi:uncharacterized protein (TIGR02598 family)
LTLNCNLIASDLLSHFVKNAAPRAHSTDAFTLIEVVLAALVLMAGLIGVIQVISSGADMLYVSRNQTVAARIIHSEIDKLRIYNWANITQLPLFPIPLIPDSEKASVDLTRDPAGKILFYDGPGGMTLANTPDKRKIIDIGMTADPSFTCTRKVENVPGEPSLKKITFTVTWRNTKDQAHPHSRSGFAYFALNGLYVAFQRS